MLLNSTERDLLMEFLEGVEKTVRDAIQKVINFDGEIENEIRSIEADLNTVKLTLVNKRMRDDENRLQEGNTSSQ